MRMNWEREREKERRSCPDQQNLSLDMESVKDTNKNLTWLWEEGFWMKDRKIFLSRRNINLLYKINAGYFMMPL